MHPRTLSSLTPSWRTRHFPACAEPARSDRPSSNAGTQNAEASAVMARSPAARGLLYGLAPALPMAGQIQGPGIAERNARMKAEQQWLSQVAGGRAGAYMLHAQLACTRVKAMLPKGSNALHDTKVGYEQGRELNQRLSVHLHMLVYTAAREGHLPFEPCVDDEGAPMMKVLRSDVAGLAEIALRHKGFATCSLQAMAAHSYLVRHLPPGTSVDMCEVRGGDHALVVIGRQAGSDPSDMRTWGSDAVVCDPWAGLVYPLSQYREMQAPQRDVKTNMRGPSGHYLGGPLQVMEECLYLSLIHI